MKNFITLPMQLLHENDLKISHWALLENIDFLSNNDTRWCFASRKKLAIWLGVSERNIFRILDTLVEKKLIEIHAETKHIRPTEKYRNMASEKSAAPMTKCHTDYDKMAVEPMTKVQPLPIKKENEEREEERTPPQKKFNHYMDVLDYLVDNGKKFKGLYIDFEGSKIGISLYGKAFYKSNLNDLPRNVETRFLTHIMNNPKLLNPAGKKNV